jgi:hypothetical protein
VNVCTSVSLALARCLSDSLSIGDETDAEGERCSVVVLNGGTDTVQVLQGWWRRSEEQVE